MSVVSAEITFKLEKIDSSKKVITELIQKLAPEIASALENRTAGIRHLPTFSGQTTVGMAGDVKEHEKSVEVRIEHRNDPVTVRAEVTVREREGSGPSTEGRVDVSINVP